MDLQTENLTVRGEQPSRAALVAALRSAARRLGSAARSSRAMDAHMAAEIFDEEAADIRRLIEGEPK